jgi:hypothetical protein
MSLRSSAEILGLPTRLADREYAPTPGDASGLPELRSQCHIGDGAVPEHSASRLPRACRGTSDRVSRRPGEPVARAEPGTLRTAISD